MHKPKDWNDLLRAEGNDAVRARFDDPRFRRKVDLTETKTKSAVDPDWWRKELIDVQQLCGQQFPDVRYVVPGLFPEGVTLLASRPKLGKSWLMLQIGLAVANGFTTLVSSDEPPECGDVLYLALEDSPRRLQRRMKKHCGPNRDAWPRRFTPVTNWKRLYEGGVEALRAWCKSVEKPSLILIDVLKRVRAPRGRNQTDYDADYEACRGLQELAGEFGIAIIVAHHDRKMDADDPFDTVSGTLGLTGGVDTIAVMKRKGNAVTLHIEGRDLIDNVEKAIHFDRETCRWTILGEAVEVQRSGERQRVLTALGSVPDGLRVAEIVAAASLASRNAADKLLFRMLQDGDVMRVKHGVYALPGRMMSNPRQMRQIVRSGLDILINQEDMSSHPDLPKLTHQSESQIRQKRKSDISALKDQTNLAQSDDLTRDSHHSPDDGLDIPAFLRRRQ